MNEAHGFVRVGGSRLFYRAFGKPDRGTVLGLHGTGGTNAYLTPLTDMVQFGYRVVLYDQLGCGRSGKPRGKELYTESRVVEEVEALRRALRLGRVHLFGNSSGGAIALDFALRYPRSVRSLVVSSGFASKELRDKEGTRIELRMPKAVRAIWAEFQSSGDLENPDYLKAVDFFAKRHICRLRVWPYDFWYMIQHLSYPVEEDTRLKGWDVTPRLREIKVPCLVTVGKYDLVPPKCARTIHHGIRGSKLVEFRKSAHVAFWEEREQYMEILHDFLDKIN
jgi:proline iminopeptidase